MKNSFEVVYLQLTLNDLLEIFNYVVQEFKSPQTANDLLNKIDESISNLKYFPYSGKKYITTGILKNEYRYLMVNHFLVFYTVYDNLVEIYRVIYSKRKYTNFL
jgi:toxin ParE1/3/4